MPFHQMTFVVTVLGFVSVFGSPVAAAEYNGRVTMVEDGDTFYMHSGSRDVKIRLCGVDSPERASKRYPKARAAYFKAREALIDLVHDKTVRCVQVGARAGTPCDRRSRPRSRDRIVAQCFLGDIDVASEMVRSGNACDWPKFSDGHYRLTESTCINPN